MAPDVRTWIEIDARALRQNAEQFLRIVPQDTRLMAVIKSNAYGHGLSLIAKILAESKNFKESGLARRGPPKKNERGWFGVDSVVEALRLRKDGIKNPILVLGHTLPSPMSEAAAKNIIVSIANFESLEVFAALRKQPAFHLKFDTGMCRQGFLPQDLPGVIQILNRRRIVPHGIFTHFASAKDPDDPAFTRRQFKIFLAMLNTMERAGFAGFIRHACATGGTLLCSEAHLDMVRIGMGLYGYWPSEEIQNTKRVTRQTILKPVLTWKSLIAEVKKIPKGSRVGYDGTERMRRDTMMAIVPVGYWHGYDRGLSARGAMLVAGRRAKVLGRVSMDMTVIDVTGIPNVRVGNEVVLIGTQGKEKILADELAAQINTTAYELLTRINPLIKRMGAEGKSRRRKAAIIKNPRANQLR